jgi:uncharacterized membrane protein YkvA (DUF1232 family)
MKIKNNEILKYRKYYNENKLSEKIFAVIGKVSDKVLYYVFLLLLLISDKSIPKKVRLVFMAALGYFILPSDIIADVLPVFGFADDIAFLTYAISSASQYITPELKQKAEEKMNAVLKKDVEE